MSLKEKAASIWARLVKQYRMVLYDQESLSQSRHLIFKPIAAILVGLASCAVVAGFTAIIIYVLPGGAGLPANAGTLSEEYTSLQRKNQQLEKEVSEMDSMLKVFTQVMEAGKGKQVQPKVYAENVPAPAAQPEARVNETPEPAQPAKAGNTPSQPAAQPTAPRKGPRVLNLLPPIDGYAIKQFDSMNKPHFGIDLAADPNAMVRSVADGMVIFSEYSTTTGHVVGIWHGRENMISFYKHNSRTFKTVGEYVYAGEAIAVIGNTGISSTGMHLHFELWLDNHPVNPADYIHFN